MKKKQKKQQICIDTVLKQKISTLYLGFMMVAFSLYYQDAFFNIAQAKRGIYIWSTIVYIILMLLFSIYSLTRDFKGILKAKKDIVGIFIVLLIVSWAIGMFFAVNPKESFLGEYNKCTGLVMYLVGILAMIYLSKYLEWKIELIWSFLFATGLVYFLQIINRFNLDPLNMYERISDDQRMQYLSTLGHGNYNAAYNCLTIVMVMVLFYLCKEKSSKIVYGIVLFLGFAGSICCCADSVYIGIGIAFVVLTGYTLRNSSKLLYLFSLLALFVSSSIIICMINLIAPNWSTGFWGISGYILKPSVILVEIVVLVLVGAVFFLFKKPLEKYSGIISKIYVYIIIGLIVTAVITMIIVNIAGINSGILGGLYIDDDWGSSRGSIWKTVISLLAASSVGHLLFGYGYNMVKDALDLVLGMSNSNLGQGIADAHNIFLNSLVTAGIVGTAIFVAIIAVILIRGFKLLRENENGLFVVIGLLVFIGQGVINGPQSITTPVFLIELGVFWNLVRCDKFDINNVK